MESFGNIVITLVFIAIVIAIVIAIIIKTCFTKKTKFDDKFKGESVGDMIGSAVGGSQVAYDKYNKAGGLNANNVAGSLNISGSKIKHNQAVGGLFCYVLQQIGRLDKTNVLGSRKLVASNFVTADGTSQCMLYMQKLVIKKVPDVNLYINMANEGCNERQKLNLVASLFNIFGERKLSDGEWNLIYQIMVGIQIDPSIIDVYRRQYTNAE